MREIKVRGYAVEEMVESQWTYGTGVHKTVFTDKYVAETGIKHKYYIYTDSGFVEVFGETIGQYTGVKDKSGREIYEGDIVKYPHIVGFKDLWKVEFDNGSFVMRETIVKIAFRGLAHKNSLEFIGNIYENPELLKGDK